MTTQNANFPAGATIVFGGSGGIGRGVALEFAREGSSVAIVYRSKQEVAEQAAAQIRELGATATIHRADVRERAERLRETAERDAQQREHEDAA